MLHIVIYQPEIAENTGNIARTCVGFNAHLHLIRPYGFFLNSPKLKRSAVNYWDKLQLTEYDCWDDFVKINKINQSTHIYYITRYGIHTSDEIVYPKHNVDFYLIFGKESTGIDKQILKENKDKTIRIPTTSNIRALNLANCVAMLAYEYTKNNKFKGMEKCDPFKNDVIKLNF